MIHFLMGYFWAIFFGTFVLEDAALVSAVTLMAQKRILIEHAFMACFLGIAIGDVGLYALGWSARTIIKLQKLSFVTNKLHIFLAKKQSHSMNFLIVLSRFIPGTRLPTYLAAGFLNFPFLRFIVLTVLSVGMWVGLALLAGEAIGTLATQHLWVTASLVLLFLTLVKWLIPLVFDHWKRRAFYHSWRRWMHFEFWPALLFYSPIVPLYIYRSIRGRSFLLPFYANPQTLNGGLIGESKWDFLKHLNNQDPATLKAILIEAGTSLDQACKIIYSAGFQFPFILKPDIGQRGYGVRIIHSEFEMKDYLESSRHMPILAQSLSRWSHEAGIFYYRKPLEKLGTVFSITDKQFPFIVGDGKTKLGALVLKDKRARIIAPVYFARHRKQLDTVLSSGAHFYLSECGNHCQGAIFKNGNSLMSPALTHRIETLARGIPDFYFGRFDIRYKDHHSLSEGLNIEIVEVNGAGSEATHIWDSKTKISEAYRVLFFQWKILFEIGLDIKKQNRPHPNIYVFRFLLDCLKVFRRSDSLSVSS